MRYNVTFVLQGKTYSTQCDGSRLSKVDGRTVYRYNTFFKTCYITQIEEIAQTEVDAQAAYFARYGTAAE